MSQQRVSRSAWILRFAAAMVAAAATPTAVAQPATPWVEGHAWTVRLIAGSVARGAKTGVFAGIEVRMPQGWKTYWRSPGDSGGLSPSFDWTGSDNLASASVLYPAPRRFDDGAGDTVGYGGHVTFPVEIRPADPFRPVALKLRFAFGACREICVPAEAHLSLLVPPAPEASPRLAAALDEVPRVAALALPGDPKLKRAVARLEGDRPSLIVEALFPTDPQSGDVFVEAPEGIYVPLPKRLDERDGVVRFKIDLTHGVEPETLRGKTLTITMVGRGGHAEATWTIN